MYQRTKNYERLYLIISEPKYTPESYVFKARLPVTSDATPVFSKLKSRGLIHSGFHLSVRDQHKTFKTVSALRGVGGREGGVKGKISLAQ